MIHIPPKAGAIIGPLAKRHLNVIECFLDSFVIFRGSGAVLLKKTIFLDFPGGVQTPCPLPSGSVMLLVSTDKYVRHAVLLMMNPYRLGPRVKKIENGYPESSKNCYSINLKKYIWCIRNHCIASFSKLHNATRANKVW